MIWFECLSLFLCERWTLFFPLFFNQTLTLTLTGIQSKTCTWYAYQQAKQAGPSQRAIHTALNIFAVCFFLFSNIPQLPRHFETCNLEIQKMC